MLDVIRKFIMTEWAESGHMATMKELEVFFDTTNEEYITQQELQALIDEYDLGATVFTDYEGTSRVSS